MPTGICNGKIRVRPTQSASSISTAPNEAASSSCGSTRRAPSITAICGAKSPRNATGPSRLVTSAHSSATSTSSTRRKRGTFKPRLAATPSPMPISVSARWNSNARTPNSSTPTVSHNACAGVAR